ncbi:MAG: ATP-binding cassette domain-containing protein [Candidatus Neomarinimicrobiota bacterium]
MKPPAIKIQNLAKSYNGTVALRDVSISIPEGQFFGLLGPNGAGKTTTINILTGLVNRDTGETEVFGRDTIKDYRFTRSQIGVAAQELSIDWFFPVESLLYIHAGYFGISKKNASEKIEELLVRLGLDQKRKSRLRQLSGGMKRRFQIAKALVHDPQIIILDEPTAGVDVELRHELWQYLRDLHGLGKTILLTTHYIEEAEMLCEKVAIIDKGKVIANDSPKNLTRQLGKSGITIACSGCKGDLSDALSDFQHTYQEGRIHFSVKDPEAELPKIINVLSKQGVQIQRVETSKSSLEDVFLHLTGKDIHTGDII